jgi:tetratricopeptide (TPR) repeat protein
MERFVHRPAGTLLFLGLTLLAGLPASSRAGQESAFEKALARADELYGQRATGAAGGRAAVDPAERAIAAYREALALDPDSAPARGGLLKAIFFRSTFCDIPPESKRAITEEARAIADEGLERLEKATDRPKHEAEIEALRATPGSAELLFWVAVAWGEWAQNHSRFAAVRARAPSRIRDLAQRVVEVDPDLREGGGYLILGRLHDKTPSIPFVSGFVSSEKALSNLRMAYGAYPGNTINAVYLAEAIFRHDPPHRDEARRILTRVAAAKPRADYAVEDAHYIGLARKLLADPP